MSAQETKDLARRIWEESSTLGGDASRVDAWLNRYCSPDFVLHGPLSGDMNFDQFRNYLVALGSGFDYHYGVKQVLVEGDMVVSRFTLSLTHKGAFQGFPATGNKFQVEGAAVGKMRGNKCEEIWYYFDTLGMMRGIGAIPAAAPRK